MVKDVALVDNDDAYFLNSALGQSDRQKFGKQFYQRANLETVKKRYLAVANILTHFKD